jgi:predicted Zn-ribbon and HTH transcriptional regulator
MDGADGSFKVMLPCRCSAYHSEYISSWMNRVSKCPRCLIEFVETSIRTYIKDKLVQFVVVDALLLAFFLNV